MNCPKCGNITENGVCSTCGKSVKEIYLKLYNEAQGNRDYDTAIYYIEDLKKYAESEEEIKEYEEIVNRIEFVKMNESEMGQKAVKIKNIRKLGRLTKSGRIKRGIKLVILILILVFIGASIYRVYNKVITNSDIIINGNKLSTVIVVNMSEPLSKNIQQKDEKYYSKILEMFRKHKDIKINLSLSGSMLQSMKMYNSQTLNIIKDGIADGQFEIIGSTYSQNVMESLEIYSNLSQLERDKELKKILFGEEPLGFYNPQGIWGKESINLISKIKYRYSFIDDVKLEKVKSGYLQGKTGEFKEENIIIYPFIKKLEIEVKKIITEKRENNEEQKLFFSLLREVYEKEKEYQSVSAIFINFDEIELTDKNIENFNNLLIQIKQKEWIETYRGKEILKKEKPLYTIQNLLGNSEAEIGGVDIDGYKNWYDLARDSKKMTYYKEIQNSYSKYINEKSYKNYAKENLKKIANNIIVSSQYKFGTAQFLSGEKEFNSGKRRSINESIKKVECIKDIMEGLNNIQDRIYEKDVTGDGNNETIVINNRNYYVLTSENKGKIIGWYDLNTGEEIIPIFNGFENKGILNTLPIEEERAEVEVFGNKLVKFKSKSGETLIRFTNKGIKMTSSITEELSGINLQSELTTDFPDILKNGKEVIKVESDGFEKIRVFNKNSGTGIEFYGGKESVIISKKIFGGIEVMIQIPNNKGIIEVTKIIAGKE
jgi:hypothetical protein